MENLRQEINNFESKAINQLYNALLEYQQKSGKDYFVIERDDIGIKYFDSLNGLCAIPLGSICANNDKVMWCGKEDYTLSDFHHYMFDYEDTDHYKALKSDEIILSDILTLCEMVTSKL